MIYVHSKLMIIDDRIAIISSANMNDRSLMGHRDSELGAIIEDTNMIESTMGGKRFLVGKFAHDLRMKLWKTFLGLTDDKLIKDPILFYDKWVEQATNNTHIYLQVFEKMADNIYKESDLQYLKEYGTRVKNVHLLENIKGYIVLYPKNFLKDSVKCGKIFKYLDKVSS